MNKIINSILVLMLSTVLIACGSVSQGTTNETGSGSTEEVIEGTSLENAIAEGSISEALIDGTMSVGICDNIPAFMSFDEDGKAEGEGLALINELGSKINANIEVKQLSSDELISSIGSTVDIGIANASGISEYDGKALVSDVIYESAQSVLVPIDSDADEYADLLGKRIGCIQYTEAEIFIDGLCAEDGTTEIKLYSNMEEAANDLVEGNLDAFIVSQEIAQDTVSSISDKVKTLEGKDFGIESEKSETKRALTALAESVSNHDGLAAFIPQTGSSAKADNHA